MFLQAECSLCAGSVLPPQPVAHRTSKHTDLFADHMGGGYQGSPKGQENPQYIRETWYVSNVCDGNLEFTHHQYCKTMRQWKPSWALTRHWTEPFLVSALLPVAECAVQMAVLRPHPSAKIKAPSLVSWETRGNTIRGWKCMIQFLLDKTLQVSYCLWLCFSEGKKIEILWCPLYTKPIF